MLSARAKYGLRALLYLAEQGDKGIIQGAFIAETQGIPKKFLDMILLELKNNGYLQSKIGKGGGYRIAKAPEKITVGEILRLLDGSLALVSCVNHKFYKACQDCPHEEECQIRHVMQKVHDATAEILDNTSLSDMLNSSNRKFILTYEI
jgi:Rrf2 family protein